MDIDPIQTQINEYRANNINRIIETERLTCIDAYEPLMLYLSNNRYSKYKVFELLDNKQKDLLDELYHLIDKVSTETWLMYLRRIHTLHKDSEYLRVLNILLVNNMNKSKLKGFIQELSSENDHIIVTDIDTSNDLLDLVFLVSFKIKVICSMTKIMRLVGKGMIITGFDESCLYPKFEINDIIDRSLNYYDNYHVPFSKLALPVYIDVNEIIKMEKNHDSFGLIPIKEPVYINHDTNDFLWAIIHYMPCSYGLNDVFKLLDKYSESIEIVYNVSMQSIRYVIYALSKLTGDTLLSLFNTLTINDGKIYSSIDLNEKGNPVKFSFDLLNKGYLHFKKDNLINRVCSIEFENLDISKKVDLINKFIKAFCIPKSNNIKIYSEYIPFMYLTKCNNIVIDYTSMFYFIESLLKVGKEYYATMHGDRFNAYARLKLSAVLPPDMFQYDKNRNIINNDNEKTQIDVIVNIDNTIYVIECKAFEKTAQYMKGHPKKIANRISLFNQAVEQAKRSCRIAGAYIDGKFNKQFKYEWIVCSADREFINPLDKYGFLYNEIPKVCTIEEIIEFFKIKSKLS